MQDNYTLVPFTQELLRPAVDLFTESYKREQKSSPLLPSRVIDDPDWIYQALQACLTNPGVAIVDRTQVLMAYMVTGSQWPWKGQQAALVPEYGHGAVAANERELYQQMYRYLAQEWANNGAHLHVIGHFAHATTLQETLYQLGFGAILAERLRDCSSVVSQSDVAVVAVKDVSKLLELQIEHNQYYPQAPIFIGKPTEKQEVLAELEAHARQDDVFFVYYEQHEPCAYVIVGESTIGGEGFLLQQTNTAQIKSAFARQEIRRGGIGTALLQCAVQWSQDHGYDRIFVEHETANISGGGFWGKHFTPYVYFSMRYIDSTI